MRKKRNRKWPFPEMDRQTDPRREKSESLASPGRRGPLIFGLGQRSPAHQASGDGCPAQLENLPKGSAGKHLSLNQAIYSNFKSGLLEGRRLVFSQVWSPGPEAGG